jgi:hypothetical protein
MDRRVPIALASGEEKKGAPAMPGLEAVPIRRRG